MSVFRTKEIWKHVNEQWGFMMFLPPPPPPPGRRPKRPMKDWFVFFGFLAGISAIALAIFPDYVVIWLAAIFGWLKP